MKNSTKTSAKYLAGFSSLIVILSILAFTPKPQSLNSSDAAAATSQIKVSGTSNLHDWNMIASNFTADGSFTIKGGQLNTLSSLSFTLPVKNLKSKETLLNTRAYKALNEENFSKITFKLTKAAVVPQQKIIKATGNLTISGVTREIDIQAEYVLNSDATITCKGAKRIKMSDYKIKAPSFMLGALKTGDEVLIDLVLNLKN